MGILTRALQRKTVDFTETLAAFAKSLAGVTVTEEGALKVSAVWACVRNISEDIGSVPLLLYERQQPGGRRRAVEHPLYPLLHVQPNPEMSAMQLRETITAHLLTWGNAYTYIVRDGREIPRELWPLLPDRTEPRRDPHTRALEYHVYDQRPDGRDRKPSWIAPAANVMHLAGLGFDGRIGYSPVRMHMQAIGLARAGEEFAARFFGQGMHAGGFFKTSNQLSDVAYERLKNELREQRSGLPMAHLWTILEEGLEYQKLGVPPEEAQFIQSRQFQVEDLARIYRMPPHKIQHLLRSTFSNIEHQGIEYVTDTLRPWAVRWEQAVLLKLLRLDERERFYAEHLFEGLLRGDTITRYESYTLGRQGGWLNADEIRSFENMPPLPDGKGQVYLEPENMRPSGTFDESDPLKALAGRRAGRRNGDQPPTRDREPEEV